MKVIYILALALVVVCVHVAYANPVPGDVDGVDEIPEDADLKGGQRRQLRYRKFYDEIPPPDEISEDADLKGGQRRQLRFPKLYDEIPPPEADGLPPPEADGRNLRCGHHCPLNHIIVKHYRAYDAIPPPEADGGDLRDGCNRNTGYRFVKHYRAYEAIPPPEDLNDGGEFDRNPDYRGLTNIIRGIARFVKKL